MNDENYTYAIYIKAVKPVYTYQLVFSSCSSRDDAAADALKSFDKNFPTASDRAVDRILDYKEYLKEVEYADAMNYWMSR